MIKRLWKSDISEQVENEIFLYTLNGRRRRPVEDASLLVRKKTIFAADIQMYTYRSGHCSIKPLRKTQREYITLNAVFFC